MAKTKKPFFITWGAIKKKIESQGVTDDTEVSYIDSHGDYKVQFRSDKYSDKYCEIG